MIICAAPSPRARICRAHFSRKVEFCAVCIKPEASKAGIGASAAKANFVRCLPVHARCSERWLVLDPPFVGHAAKVSGEPRASDAAAWTNVQSGENFIMDLEIRPMIASLKMGILPKARYFNFSYG
jgi:hypothetical protein